VNHLIITHSRDIVIPRCLAVFRDYHEESGSYLCKYLSRIGIVQLFPNNPTEDDLQQITEVFTTFHELNPLTRSQKIQTR